MKFKFAAGALVFVAVSCGQDESRHLNSQSLNQNEADASALSWGKGSRCFKRFGMERINLSPVQGQKGPEDAAFGPDDSIYTGFNNGDIVQVKNDGSKHLIANTGGRPLGLAVNQANHLIVADADKGLLRVDLESYKVDVLTNQHDGVPFKLTDDLIIAKNGTIYFTDASSVNDIDHSIMEALTKEANGRLLSYNPKSKETRRILEDLHFPNGLALSQDEQFLLINESTKYQTLRYWLKGEKAGDVEIFAEDLPGFPDNVNHAQGEKGFWVALAGGKNFFTEKKISGDQIGKFLDALPPSITTMLLPKAKGRILKLDYSGQIIEDIQLGDCFKSTTSAMEKDGHLYLGSFHERSLVRIKIP